MFEESHWLIESGRLEAMGIAAALLRLVSNAEGAIPDEASKPEDRYAYKAFISYSHSADGKLAPAVQRGLHRFAKPWYRLRAMRVFRDETTLSTSPELWPSIESALSQSEYFLYLASPEAAESFWVRKEFEYWVKHRSKDRMLIILTDGELAWDRDAQDFDWAKTTAVPRDIDHSFQDEPLYLDLRWARTEDQLSLSNLKFRSDIADVASTLLGQSKDALVGEDVRQHRRTRKIAFSAILTLAVLAIASVLAAVVAVQNQREAEKRGAIALSRQLATQAVALAGSDRGDLAILLSLEAINVHPTVDARNGLLSGLTRDPYRLFHLHGHMGQVQSLAFSPDGDELLSLGCEGIDSLGLCDHFGVRRWDATNGNPSGQAILPGANSWTIFDRPSAGGSLLAHNRGAKSWDPVTGQMLGDARSLLKASQRGDVYLGRERRDLVLRETKTRRRLLAPFDRENEKIRSVAFHPSAPLVAIGGSMGQVRLWDTEALRNGSLMPRRDLDAHDAAVIDLDFSPDGQFLITSSRDNSVLMWELEAETPARRLVDGANVSSVTFSPDGRRFVIATSVGELGGELLLWNTDHWQQVRTLAGKQPVAFHSNGRLLASAGSDGAIIVRDLDRDRPLGTKLEDPGDPMSLVFLDGGRRLIAGGRDQSLRIWNVETGRLEQTPIATDQGWISALAVHPDGMRLASGGNNGQILLWDIQNLAKGPTITIAGHDEAPVAALDFSPDGAQLVSGGFDNTLRFWDPTTGDPLARKPIDTGHDVYVAKFDGIGSRVAAATEDGSILLWGLSEDGATGSVIGTHLLQTDGMTGLDFGPEDRFLVSSSLEQTQIWSLESGTPRARTPIEGSFVALGPDGEWLALATDNGEIRLVDVDNWRVFDATLGQQRDLVFGLAFSPDAKRLVSTAEGDVVVWDVSIESWRERACTLAKRNLTPEEWDRYLGDRPYAKTCPDAVDPPSIPLDAERALGLAIRAAKLGATTEAQRLFTEAASLATNGDAAELANRICWFGTLHDAFSQVMSACERAVELDPDNARYRDSRGVARALAGDVTGAIEDLRAYVSSVEDRGKLAARRDRRQIWIEALEADREPFDSMELHRLRGEGAFR